MQITKRGALKWFALVLSLALVASACGGGDDDEADQDGGAPTGGEFSMSICEPQFMQPGNTQETCGAQVMKALFTPLVDYDPQTAEPFNVVAESIESEDSQTWTVTIEDGWTFHNGEPLTAQSFVDAWNWTANAANAALNNYFFGNIEGYDELNPEKGKPDPNATLSGLKVIDDTTFEVTLTEPFSQFPLTVGYTAFYPLPKAFFDDPDAFNQAPIGNGPYQMDGKWKHDQFVKVKRYNDYAGEPGNADAIEFRIYSDVNTAYNDLLGGNIDIIDIVPTEVAGEAEQQLGEGFIRNESSYFGYIGFPLYQEPWDNVELRRAVSMAMDRAAITKAIYLDAYTPANSIISPVVPGFRETVCGEVCEHNPEEARRLWEENGGPDEIILWFNNDGGHEEWMEAFSNQLRNALGVDTKFESLPFDEYLTLQEEHKLTGPYRGAWVFDYPSPQNYLEPIFSCEGTSQEFGYEDHGCEESTELIEEANATLDLDDAVELYQQAEELILEDLPGTPTWFGVNSSGYDVAAVDNVIVTIFSFVEVAEVEVLK